MWSGRLFDGPARPRRGSSAWRAGSTGSPGALSHGGAVSRRAAVRPARAGRPGWWSCPVRQHASQDVRRRVELRTQGIGESAFVGFDDGAGVVGRRPRRERVPGRVPGGDALGVRPAPGQGVMQECSGELFAPMMPAYSEARLGSYGETFTGVAGRVEDVLFRGGWRAREQCAWSSSSPWPIGPIGPIRRSPRGRSPPNSAGHLLRPGDGRAHFHHRGRPQPQTRRT